MKFKVRDIVKKEEEEENEVEFWLKKDPDGDITLMAKSSEDDEPGKVLWIDRKGRLGRYTALVKVTGLMYDDSSCKIHIHR